MTAPTVRPPRCGDSGSYDKPPEQSARCTWWLARFDAGWRPNRRISGLGYYGAAIFYGVWIWEYLNVIAPRLRELEGRAS